MQTQISKKIIDAFNDKNFNERDLVFILSRIRKMLESFNSFGKYKFLSLYCNWALHVQIDKTDVLSDLNIFIDDKNIEEEVRFMSHQHFFAELRKFDTEYLGQSLVLGPEDTTKIADLLNEIFSDTPLIISRPEKIKVEIKVENDKTYWKAIEI